MKTRKRCLIGEKESGKKLELHIAKTNPQNRKKNLSFFFHKKIDQNKIM